MERFTEKLEDGRNVVRDGISSVYNVKYGRFLEGEAVNKLAEYEDAEEQGLLIRLPCKVGSEVYIIDRGKIIKGKVDGYKWWRSCGFCLNVVWDRPIMEDHNICRCDVAFKAIGKTVFLTYEEAEQKLKELQKEGADNE